MKLYEMTREQYEEWCESPQGVAFNDELYAYLEGANTPQEMYEAIDFIKAMFEREVNLDGRID